MQIALWVSASISVVALGPARNQPLDPVVRDRAFPYPPKGRNPASAYTNVIVRLAAVRSW